MGKIYKYGVSFGGGGSGSDSSVWISKEEYNALSEEEKMSDTEYFVYDDDSTGNAYAVPFSNENYEAGNVGDALVEVKESLANIDLGVKTFVYETTVSANAEWQINLGQLSNITNGEITPDTFCGAVSHYGGYVFNTYLATNNNLYVSFGQETTFSNVTMRFVIFGKK